MACSQIVPLHSVVLLIIIKPLFTDFSYIYITMMGLCFLNGPCYMINVRFTLLYFYFFLCVLSVEYISRTEHFYFNLPPLTRLPRTTGGQAGGCRLGDAKIFVASHQDGQ